MLDVTPTILYASRSASITPDQAQAFGEETAEMRNLGTPVTPESILERARDPMSPIHFLYTVDETKALHSYRIDRIKFAIRMVYPISDKNGKKPHVNKLFISLTPEGQKASTTNRQYFKVEEVQQSEDLTEKNKQTAMREALSWAHKYQAMGYHEFDPVYRAIFQVFKET